MYGFRHGDIEVIVDAVSKHPEIDACLLFGSRAMGNYKNGSDVDLAVRGAAVSERVIRELNEYLNEVSPLPYFFDILQYEAITNDGLLMHIRTIGEVLYQKG